MLIMNKILIIPLFLLLISPALWAQDCLTPATPDYLRANGIPMLRASNLSFTVKIFVHIVTDNDGTGGATREEVMTELNRLEAYYAPHDICFSLVGIDEINDTGYAHPAGDFDGAMADQLVIDYPPFSNVVNIYILPEDTFFRGTAYAIPNTYLTIYAGRFNTPHLSHEMGHCLGLYHTHETAFGAEWVSGVNCGIAGDLLCDTPADPQLDGDNVDGGSCTYIGTETDFWGDSYSPDITNTMSYAPFACRGAFTQDQEDRMHSILSSLWAMTNNILVEDVALDVCCGSIGAGRQFEASLDFITSSDYEITNSAYVRYVAEDYIALQPGFEARPGPAGDFRAHLNLYCDGDFPAGVPVNSIADNPPNSFATTGTTEKALINQIVLFPNPARGQLTITLGEHLHDSAKQIEILSLEGQLIMSIDLSSHKHDLTIDTSSLPAGSYFCRVFTPDEVQSLKFVKMD
jgi:hypothetical protein